jgi:Ala-tRNA(Pro) deacylase
MAISKKILNYLEKNKIKYQLIPHKTVYTAFDLAKTLKTDLKKILKTVIVKTEKGYILTALSADKLLDLKKLKRILKTKKVEIAKEDVMKKIFKIKPGTITPFAGLYKIPLYLEKSLLKVKEVIVCAGSYTDSVKIKLADLIKVEKPIIGVFGKKK